LSNFTVHIINCSLVSNGSDPEGKAIEGGRLNIRNSIIRYNHGRYHLSAIQNNDYTDSHISYSIVQENSSSGIYVGGTVRNVDPQFISLDGTNPDYRLQATSPAINTGDPYGTGLPPTDLAGSARVAGGRVDMGAFEFGSTLPASGLTLLVPTYDCSSGAFTFRTSGGDGRSIEYQAPSITGWSTNPNQLVDRETRIACDAPPVTLQARYVGEPASEVTLVWNIRAVCPTCGSSSGSFAITGVTSISCVISGPTERRLTFTPQYSGINGQPITFSVYNELVPTTVAGPYTLRLYTDNPTITLQAQQGGTPGTSSFAYNWLATCAMGARQGFMTEENEPELIVKVLGTPTHGEEVAIEITGVVGQSLRLTSTDVQGRVFEDLSVKMAHSREKYWLKVGSQSGLYFLRVTTSRLIQTVKVVKQ
ncbi:MAG: hypothetical protein JWP57_1549, partial [Spirosoma sp.]|nr:hypothetical protein [Spirosoma sp.]